MSTFDTLSNGLRTALGPTALAWLMGATEGTAHGTTTDLLVAYTSAGRHVPSTPFPAGSSVEFTAWTLTDAARALLLLARASAVSASAFEQDALESYEQGDTSEQVSWVRSAAHLPSPERFLPTMVDTCRTNIVPLFEAVACENPYAARYFAEGNFNQLAMKALFNDIRLSRIVGFTERRNAELARMAADFAAERRAAGRPVPIDIDAALAGAVEGTPP